MATIYTARYLFADSSTHCAGGALLEHSGRIVEVGELAALKKSHPGVSVVDFESAVILPAFINAHTHLELSDYPLWAAAAGVDTAPVGFVDWILRLIRVKRSVEAAVMHEAIIAGIRLCLASGTAAVGDVLSWYDGRKAYADSPLRGRIFLESLGQNPEITRHNYERLTKVLKESGAGLLAFGLSPHSPYTIRPQYMSQLYALATSRTLACTTHIAEAPAELDFLDGADGALIEQLYAAVDWHQYRPAARRMTPVAYLASRGGLFKGHLLVHGVQLSAAEIEDIAAAGAFLALCPRSNAQLQVGVAPVAQLKRAGVRLALGTDSLASNSSLSLWDELAYASQVYALTFSAAELFTLATAGGADALGLTDQLGALLPGRRCSFQVVRPRDLFSGQALLEGLVDGSSEPQVEALILDGVSVL